MNRQLRPDEKFVMNAMAKTFFGTWRWGEDPQEPPDAYLTIDNHEIAVEISALMQSRSDRLGRTISRLKDDMSPKRLAEELDEELGEEIPEGRGVTLVLKSPFLKKRAVKGPLKARIRDLLSSPSAQRIQENFSGNKIEIFSNNGAKYIVGIVVPMSLPINDVLTTAWGTLEERIATKACLALKFDHPIWLALRNGYPVADVETYRQAMSMSSVEHPFEKILLISRDGSVDELFGKLR